MQPLRPVLHLFISSEVLVNRKTLSFIFEKYTNLKKYYSIAAFLFITCILNAQTPPQQVISSGGGYYANSNGSVSVTIGEMVIQTLSTGTNILTEGFQQTFLANPLPLNLLSFTATLDNRQTHLQWITAQEVNTSYFDVERSADGSTFTKLLSVKSDDNAVAENTYHATDPSPFEGIDYYRLKEVDMNGAFTYSPIVFVKVTAGLTCSVYPNPASDEVFISINSNNANQAAVCLYDINGKLLLLKQAPIAPGTNLFSWNIESLAKGTYFIQVTGLDLPVIKIIKQ
jgi:hypothetical protein